MDVNKKTRININACRTLLEVDGFVLAPTQRRFSGDWVECIITIGRDETAYLSLPREAFDIIKNNHSGLDEGNLFGDEV